jgi:hypothetical protein
MQSTTSGALKSPTTCAHCANSLAHVGTAQRECQQLPQIQEIVLFGTIDAFAAGGRPFKVNSA